MNWKMLMKGRNMQVLKCMGMYVDLKKILKNVLFIYRESDGNTTITFLVA